MKKIMAVYDEDPFYAERLSDYINRREDGIFSAPGLYIQEAAGGVCQGPWDRCAPYGNAVRRRVPGLPSVQRILLTEEEVRAGEGGGHGIYKYQSGDDILREVMAAYCETPEGKTEFSGASGFGETDHRRVFPGRKMRKNVIGPGNGPASGQEEKLLFITLDTFTGFSGLLDEQWKRDFRI